jgi:hypothetical protein
MTAHSTSGPIPRQSSNITHPASPSCFVISKRILLALVFALPILTVALAILLGAYVVAQTMQDAIGARALLWIGISTLLLLAVDVLLLVFALGVNAIAARPREP